MHHVSYHRNRQLQSLTVIFPSIEFAEARCSGQCEQSITDKWVFQTAIWNVSFHCDKFFKMWLYIFMNHIRISRSVSSPYPTSESTKFRFQMCPFTVINSFKVWLFITFAYRIVWAASNRLGCCWVHRLGWRTAVLCSVFFWVCAPGLGTTARPAREPVGPYS